MIKSYFCSAPLLILAMYGVEHFGIGILGQLVIVTIAAVLFDMGNE